MRKKVDRVQALNIALDRFNRTSFIFRRYGLCIDEYKASIRAYGSDKLMCFVNHWCFWSN